MKELKKTIAAQSAQTLATIMAVAQKIDDPAKRQKVEAQAVKAGNGLEAVLKELKE